MEQLNKLRVSLRNRYLIGFFLLAIITLILTIIFKNIAISIINIIIGALIIAIWRSHLNNKYRRRYKYTFVLKALESKFTDLFYDAESGIPYSTIAETEMMRMGDRYHSEDYISAKYKDIKLEQSDVHIEEEDSDSDGGSSYVTIFKGRWVIFDFNKKFKANVQISQKGFTNSRITKKEEAFKKISMESESFNKKFNVYAQNEHDAFYIITPSLMEKIETLSEKNKGKLLFCFIDNRLHIGIYDRKDSFEPGSVFKEIDEEGAKQKISTEIETITQFIDELNLENNLFKMEG